MQDPESAVAARVSRGLQAAGIEVRLGRAGGARRRRSIRGLSCACARAGPGCACKLAMSLDGRTAMASGESQWITGEAARRDVQRLRARSSAIMTGIGTVLADDPSLDGARWMQQLEAAPGAPAAAGRAGSRSCERRRRRACCSCRGDTGLSCAASDPARRRGRCEDAGAEVVRCRAATAAWIWPPCWLLGGLEVNEAPAGGGADAGRRVAARRAGGRAGALHGAPLMGDARPRAVSSAGAGAHGRPRAAAHRDIRAVGRTGASPRADACSLTVAFCGVEGVGMFTGSSRPSGRLAASEPHGGDCRMRIGTGQLDLLDGRARRRQHRRQRRLPDGRRAAAGDGFRADVSAETLACTTLGVCASAIARESGEGADARPPRSAGTWSAATSTASAR